MCDVAPVDLPLHEGVQLDWDLLLTCPKRGEDKDTDHDGEHFYSS